MWPDRVSNPGPLTYESGALPTALRGLATVRQFVHLDSIVFPFLKLIAWAAIVSFANAKIIVSFSIF